MPSSSTPAPLFVRSVAGAALLLAGCTLTRAQAPTQDSPAAQPPPPTQTAASASPTPVSSLVQPATTELAQALPTLHPEKWKLSPELRRRSNDNITSISTDLGSTLPTLVTAADTPQPTLPALFALSRNLRALYDVVLRVATTAEIAAPEQQATALTQSLTSLSTARQQLDERLDATVATQQQQLATLQTSLTTANQSLAQAKAAAQTQPTSTASTHPRPKVRKKPPTPNPATPAPPSP